MRKKEIAHGIAQEIESRLRQMIETCEGAREANDLLAMKGFMSGLERELTELEDLRKAVMALRD